MGDVLSMEDVFRQEREAVAAKRALRAEVHALTGTVRRLEQALAERTQRVTELELALLTARDNGGGRARHPGAAPGGAMKSPAARCERCGPRLVNIHRQGCPQRFCSPRSQRLAKLARYRARYSQGIRAQRRSWRLAHLAAERASKREYLRSHPLPNRRRAAIWRVVGPCGECVGEERTSLEQSAGALYDLRLAVRKAGLGQRIGEEGGMIMGNSSSSGRRTSIGSAVDKRNAKRPAESAPTPAREPAPSVVIAAAGINDSRQFAAVFSRLIADVGLGAIDPRVCAGMCNAASKLLRVKEMELRYGVEVKGEKAKLLPLT